LRSTKKRVYAHAGIFVYWIVNLKARQIEVFADPKRTSKGPDYRRRQVYKAGSQVDVVLEGTHVGRILVQEMLPQMRTA
jgi:Uma2 family endonuclease